MIEVETRAFAKAIEIAGSVVQRHCSIPVLGQLMVHPNGKLSISGTDLDMGCTVHLPYDGAPTAPFMLPEPARMARAVKHAGGAGVLVQRGEDGVVAVAAGDFRVHAKGLPAADWPAGMVHQLGREDLTCVLGAAEMAAIARVSLAMSSEETRYYLNGVFLHAIDDWTLRAAATDGHRLFWANLKVPGGKIDRERFSGVIIPRGLVNRVLTRFRGLDEVALVVGREMPANAPAAAEGTAPAPIGLPRVTFGATMGTMGVTFCGKTIDGTFPDYSRVIPESHDARAVFALGPIRRALLSLAAAATARRPAVKMVRDRDAMRLSVAAHWGGDGDGEASVSVPMLDHAGLPQGWEVGFNGKYLIDCLNSCRGEQVTFGLNAESPSAPVSLADGEDADFGMVVMSMRV